MKLSDLHPVIETKKILVLDCPCGAGHRLPLPIGKGPNEWHMGGGIENCTLEQSVETGCWTGWIKNGEIVTAPK